jgi:3-hydroxymyristoyl/3-hydroxydecanoyl-(acyl carrier protein) dehydratase
MDAKMINSNTSSKNHLELTSVNAQNNSSYSHINSILAVLHETLSRSNQIQQKFLEHQAQVLQTVSTRAGILTNSTTTNSSKQPVITKTQLEEFGTGSIAKCFGPDFEILDQRKSPRIPNRDLLMIDRVLTISGERSKLNPPASITTEFNIPKDIWFISENKYPGVPLGILIEIALQPSGILSAYLGTSLMIPEDANLFRNLDGMITFFSCQSLTGKIVTNHSRLLTSISGGGMLIQKFAFELSTDDSVFLSGESSFGYFTQAVMGKQTGIDSEEKKVRGIGDPTYRDDYHQVELTSIFPQGDPSTKQHLDLINNLQFKENGGRFGCGIILGEKKLTGKEWFYENHFFQDPVMPGSLGIEAIMLGLWAYMKYSQPDTNFHSPRIDFSHSDPLIWKYRGQVIPANKKIDFEVHLKDKYISDSSINLTADAEFWVDTVKIYSIQNISMTLKKGQI